MKCVLCILLAFGFMACSDSSRRASLDSGAILDAGVQISIGKDPVVDASSEAGSASRPVVDRASHTSAASDANDASDSVDTGDGSAADRANHIEHVFIVAMENHDDEQIVGDTENAPYLNKMIEKYARSSNFVDTLPLAILSEPHYVLLEAGTHTFSDVTFDSDADPSATNSTASTAHLTSQMKNARPSVSFMSYQEGLDSNTGACPIHSSGAYAAKHNPLLFFQDIVGSPPSTTNPYCVAHHAPMTALADDLRRGSMARYVFVTPDLCHDMHGTDGCQTTNSIKAGDDWLKATLPALEAFATEHQGVIFIVWDEGDATQRLPFVAIGPTVKRGYVSSVRVTHASITKTVERIFALPYLDTVKDENDLSDVFETP